LLGRSAPRPPCALRWPVRVGAVDR